MSEWEELSQRLKRQEKCFDELFSADKDGMIIGSEERSKLEALRERNNRILQKLENKEFAVAVVGLEKAGKSTLGNALIGSVILPEYTERCTYTTTEIRAGQENKAEITFYTDEEFSRNFRDMLSSVGYEGEADFRTLTLPTFQRYMSSLEDNPDKQDILDRIRGKTDEDICEILRGSSTIASLLGMPPKVIDWDSEKKTSEFQIYITGIAGSNPDGSVIRSPHPYAVKNVVIRSKNLGRMSSIILYDVPGFDSTTELHKKQTERMLKEADAIILVTNVGDRPNINSPQLDMLRKVRDQDGIKLRDKTFIFGNKIDRAGNAKISSANTAALRNEAEKRYQIASGDRVISGSAKAYLESLGLHSQYEQQHGEVHVSGILEEWGMSDGIKELDGKLQEYYGNDRFSVLRKRAENTIEETAEFLRELLARYTPEVLNSIDNGGKFILELKDKAALFSSEAGDISKKYVLQVSENMPFSSSLIGKIEDIYPLSSSFGELFTDIKRGVLADIDGVMQLTKINSELREKLHILFMKNIVTEAAVIISNKQNEIRSELVNKFLAVMGMKEGSCYEDELKAGVNALFDELLVKEGEKCSFTPLVERFVSGLVETLILMPFAEPERLDKVRGTLPELYSLAVYYSMNGQEHITAPDAGKFFAEILAHKFSDAGADGAVLRQFFDDNAGVILKGASFIMDDLPFGEWAELFVSAGVSFDVIPDELARRLEKVFYKAGWDKLSREDRISGVNSALSEYLKTCRKKSTGIDEQLEEFNSAASGLKARTEEELLQILDDDIRILRDITVKAVIRATGLERAFNSVIVKNINFIRSGITEPGDGKFNKWIIRNVRKILDSEFAAIERDNMNNQTRKNIVAAITHVLGNME